MTDKYQQLAELMGAVTLDILNYSKSYQAVFNNHNIKLMVRIGSGRATYSKFIPAKKRICITYGKKMLASKYNISEAIHWLSYREIVKHGYFDSDTSLISVLSHTICHEFAHALQQINGKVYKGSIHNSDFYQILDEVHASGISKIVKELLIKQCELLSIKLEYKQNTGIHHKQIPGFKLNSMIVFVHNKKNIKGKIIKINRKTLTVEAKGIFKTTIWRVPKQRVSLSS